MAIEIPDGWEVIDGKRLRRTWRFADFASALAFVNRVGAMAEELGHHPDIELGWGRVAIEWTTHDAGGLTDRDAEAARRCADLEHASPAR